MLHLLHEYAIKNGLAEAGPGFATKYVKWAIACSKDGRFLELIQLFDPKNKRDRGEQFANSPDLMQRELIAGGKTRSHFLIDTAQVVALYKIGDDAKLKKKHESLKQKHEFFKSLLRQAASSMPILQVLANMLDNSQTLQNIQDAMAKSKVAPSDKVTFCVDGKFPVESSDWHSWWRDFRRGIITQKKRQGRKKAKAKSLPMICFIEGLAVKPAVRHPKIKRLPGALKSGAALVCFDKEAYESYNLEASTNAAMSETAASNYRAAVEHLLNNQSRIFGDVAITYWFKDWVAPEDNPLPWLLEPDSGVPSDAAPSKREELQALKRVQELLDSIKSGQRPDLGANRYYSITLSGAAGRVMVRDWMEGDFPVLVENIRNWFADLEVVDAGGKQLAWEPRFSDILSGLRRPRSDEEPPGHEIARLWRAAVNGEPIPRFAIAQGLDRTKVDIITNQQFNYARLGLLKAYHVRKERLLGKESDMKPYLNEDHPAKAYHCGRLMAVLARVQERALGDVGAGVVQRYYAAASSTPALVFGRLIRLSQHHLAKIEPERLRRWFEEHIKRIISRLGDEIPTTLDLEGQSLFALGYYQQLASLSAGKAEEQGTENN